MPGNGQLRIFDSAEATTRQLESQSNQGYMAEIVKRLDNILRQADPFVESCK
jgi:hypothetical protein